MPLLNNNNNIKKEIFLYKVYKQQFELSGQCRKMCINVMCISVSVCWSCVCVCVSIQTEEVILSSGPPEGTSQQSETGERQSLEMEMFSFVVTGHYLQTYACVSNKGCKKSTGTEKKRE